MKIIKILSFIVVLDFIIIPVYAVDTTHVQINNAIKLQQQGEMRPALKVFENVLKKKPEHKKALEGAGVSALQLGMYDTAVYYIKRSLEIDPGNIKYLNNLASAYMDSGRITEAQEILKKINKLTPGNSSVISQIEYIDQLISKQAKDETNTIIVALLSEGLQAYNSRKYDSALEKCNEVLEIDPAHKRALKLKKTIIRVSDAVRFKKLYIKTIKHFDPKRIEKTLRAGEKYLKIYSDPTLEGFLCEGYINYASYLNTQKKHQRALNELNKAMGMSTAQQSDAINLEIKYQMAVAFAGMGNWKKAYIYFKDVYNNNSSVPGISKKYYYAMVRSHLIITITLITGLIALVVTFFMRKEWWLSNFSHLAGRGKADYFFSQMEWQKAVEGYEKFIKGKEPGELSPGILQRYGMSLLKIGRETDATNALFNSIKNGSKDKGVWKTLLKTLEKKNDPAGIARLAELVLGVPELFDAEEEFKLRDYIAVHNKQTGNFKSSLKEFRRMIQLKPAQFEPRFHHIETLIEMKNFQDAVGELEEMLKTDPNWLGYVIKFYQRIIEISPDFLRARHDLAEIYRNNGQPDESINEFYYILEKAVDRETFLVILGDLLYQRTRFTEALNVYYELCQLHPDSLLFRYKLGDIYLRLDEMENAYITAEQILQIDPYNIDAIRLAKNIAIAYRKKNLIEESKSVLNKTIEKNPLDNTELWFELGKTFMAEKKYHDGITELQKVTKGSLKLKYEALDLIASCWMEMGDYKMAANVLSGLALDKVRLDLNLMKSIEYHLARSYEELGEIDRAVTLYERILRVDINYKDVGDIIRRIKNIDDISSFIAPPASKRKSKKSKDDEVVCQKCAAVNPVKKKYCGECGTLLGIICGKCGQANEPKTKFCGACGEVLS